MKVVAGLVLFALFAAAAVVVVSDPYFFTLPVAHAEDKAIGGMAPIDWKAELSRPENQKQLNQYITSHCEAQILGDDWRRMRENLADKNFHVDRLQIYCREDAQSGTGAVTQQ